MPEVQQSKDTSSNKNNIKNFHHMLVLDESGSMSGLKKMVIDTFNESIQHVRKLAQDNPEQNHFIHLVTFNSGTKLILENQSINEVKEIGQDDYRPDQLTAMYDGIGRAISTLEEYATDDESTALVTIITDGHENASNDYTGPQIKELVDQYKDKGWLFDYVGAEESYESTSASLGITNASKWSADAKSLDNFSKMRSIKTASYVSLANTPGSVDLNARGVFSAGDLDNFDEAEYEAKIKKAAEGKESQED